MNTLLKAGTVVKIINNYRTAFSVGDIGVIVEVDTETSIHLHYKVTVNGVTDWLFDGQVLAIGALI